MLGNGPSYVVGDIRLTRALRGRAALIGPAGLVGVGFLRLAAVARRYAASGWRIPIATAACLGSGAVGGLHTPSLATGGVLGITTGHLWSVVWPDTPIAGFALLAAAAVLTVTQRAPLCAMVLTLEFTHTGLTFLVPMMLAVAGAAVTARALPGHTWTARARPPRVREPSRRSVLAEGPTAAARFRSAPWWRSRASSARGRGGRPGSPAGEAPRG